MFSISQDIENEEFDGWLNSEMLLKNNRRQTGSRKRGYDLANIDLNEECESVRRRRVLRPRHDPETDPTPDASRTRPIRSNRVRQRQIDRANIQPTVDAISEPGPLPSSTTVPEMLSSQYNGDLSLLQAFNNYNLTRYFLPNSDSSLLQRIQQANYPTINNSHLNQRIPQFDPWVLHNYLLGASYSAVNNSNVTPDIGSNDPALRIPYLGMPPDMNISNTVLWQYSLLNQPINVVPNQPNRSSHDLRAHSTGSTQMELNSDYSYYSRFLDPTQLRDSVPTSNEALLFSGIYIGDSRLPNYCSPMISNPFAYGYVCPYHTSGHLFHNTNQSSSHVAGSGSSQSETVTSQSQSQNTFTSVPRSSGVTSFDHQFWPHMTPAMRPLHHPLNGSNIDTLLHLAAHFEQRKRGLRREELDKLPTHRYKASNSDKSKDKNSVNDTRNNCSDDPIKCLVCLEDFEPKQNIRMLRCDHEFHAKCIDKWLKINRTCPLCRADAFDGSAQQDGA